MLKYHTSICMVGSINVTKMVLTKICGSIYAFNAAEESIEPHLE